MARKKDKLDYEWEEYFRRHRNLKRFVAWKIIKAGDYLVYHDSRFVRTVGKPIAYGLGFLVLATKRFWRK